MAAAHRRPAVDIADMADMAMELVATDLDLAGTDQDPATALGTADLAAQVLPSHSLLYYLS